MWKVLSASVRGSSHEQSGQPCQDANFWHIIDDRVLIAAVADGAGSASMSEVGAQTVVEASVKYLIKHSELSDLDLDKTAWEDLSYKIYRTARAAVQSESEDRQIPLSRFASTLLLLLSTPEYTATMQIGDGSIVGKDSNGRVSTISKPTRSEYINQTTFVTSENAGAMIQADLFRGIDQIAIFSDGLELLALRMPELDPFQPFFEKIFEFSRSNVDRESGEQQLLEFLRSPRLRKRTNDDVTLLLADFIGEERESCGQ